MNPESRQLSFFGAAEAGRNNSRIVCSLWLNEEPELFEEVVSKDVLSLYVSTLL